ncbi:nucleotide sugar dehydrogenase [Heliobacterium undosum]|uniref:Nucleotide sugar dehydrogenase n=1 Tax=Heliomicrobium undosum TaxID=121734 RepID=A0A845L704_9FIRM|nr:nucleotide sugar dehydrogenase [Heliomicrobium undosum]MZP29518.1 nucleotide sugar dehydrogenase [Heliomicrobium undosum]
MSSSVEDIKTAIQNRTASIGIIGLGYVGLPLAVVIAGKGFKVMGFDVQDSRVRQVNEGMNYIGDVVGARLEELVQSGYLRATTDFDLISDMDVIVICVPTPLDVHQQPDLRYVIASGKAIASRMKPGALVILESTTYPGTTEEIIQPILEGKWDEPIDSLNATERINQVSRVCGEDFFLAFSPERVDPGNERYKTGNTPKIIGGVTENCSAAASLFYKSVLDAPVFTVSSPRVAEMEKLLENIFRLVNIGLVNEMAVLCKQMRIDIWEVIEAAKTKPYGFMAFYPGPGLGGHCIPIDPFYLTYKAKEFGLQTRLIETAGDINRQMPHYVVQQSMRILNEQAKAVKGARILLLGMAYKADIDDWRESPALEIFDEFIRLGADVFYHDPWVDMVKTGTGRYGSIDIAKEELEKIDLCIITTDHSNVDYEKICEGVAAVFDTRNIVTRKGLLLPEGKYHKL